MKLVQEIPTTSQVSENADAKTPIINPAEKDLFAIEAHKLFGQ